MAKTTVKSPGARRGRPALKPGSPKRSSFNTRLRAETKKRLEAAAHQAGRSLSEEIEVRLERTFDKEAADDRVLASVLASVHERFGGEGNFTICLLISQVMTLVGAKTGQDWLTDHQAFNEAREGIDAIVDNIGPYASVPVEPVSFRTVQFRAPTTGIGKEVAERILASLVRRHGSAERAREED